MSSDEFNLPPVPENYQEERKKSGRAAGFLSSKRTQIAASVLGLGAVLAGVSYLGYCWMGTNTKNTFPEDEELVLSAKQKDAANTTGEVQQLAAQSPEGNEPKRIDMPSDAAASAQAPGSQNPPHADHDLLGRPDSVPVGDAGQDHDAVAARAAVSMDQEEISEILTTVDLPAETTLPANEAAQPQAAPVKRETDGPDPSKPEHVTVPRHEDVRTAPSPPPSQSHEDVPRGTAQSTSGISPMPMSYDQISRRYRNDKKTVRRIKTLKMQGHYEEKLQILRELHKEPDYALIPALADSINTENHRYNWQVVMLLRQITGEDFGLDAEKWRAWYFQTPDSERTSSP